MLSGHLTQSTPLKCSTVRLANCSGTQTCQDRVQIQFRIIITITVTTEYSEIITLLPVVMDVFELQLDLHSEVQCNYL